jgi:predicted ATPase/class 3 adenylate cyclase
MQTLTENPSAYLPIDRRRALAQGEDLPERQAGVLLFADISGFTPLTDAFARAYGPRRGIDEFTQILNQVYNNLIAQIHRYCGSVIGFSGDAITCWFGQGEQSRVEVTTRGVAAGLAMQQAMHAFTRLQVGDGLYPLAIKVVIGGGEVRRFVVGSPKIQLFDVLTGDVLSRVEAMERQASQGDVLLDEELAHLLGSQVEGTWRQPTGGRILAVTGLDATLPQSPPVTAEPPDLPMEIARQWLLPSLYERIQGEQSRFLAELRPAVALFLNFSGIDYEADPDAGQKLNAFVQQVQWVIHRYEGALIQLTTGDKGNYLYAAFGAPIAHGDDTRRAVAAALDLRSSAAQHPAIQQIRIGISQGRMRTGAYGSHARRTYGVLGDEVNLAARLMIQAEAGQILVSPRVAEQITGQYRLRPLGERPIKGKPQPIPLFAVEGAQQDLSQQIAALFAQPLVGRDGELAQFTQSLRLAQGGTGQIVRVVGEAGVGKSHLAAACLERALAQEVQVAVGGAQSIEQGVAYGVARQIACQLLGLNTERSAGEQVLAVTGLIQGMNPDWSLRLPLLGDLLGLPIPDTETTAAFPPQLRQEALIALVVEIVRARAGQRPLLLLFEDIHWIDEASRLLLLSLARVISDVPILLLLIHRPLGPSDESFADQLESLPDQTQLHLTELDEAGIAGLVAQRLGGTVSPLALALIQAQGQGNPFFTEELVDALVEAGDLLPQSPIWGLSPRMVASLREAGALMEEEAQPPRLRPGISLAGISLGLPDSIHGLVLSRLDRLPEPVKLTLKVASVIGRVFDAALLIRVYPGQMDEDLLFSQLETLSHREFARLERPQPHLAYIFKHNITQEVVYRTLLESQQQTLHQSVAQELEMLDPAAVERLAFHYRHGDLSQSGVRQKAAHYLAAAGEKAQREYANETALGHLERALKLEPRWAWMAARIDVLHILGRREEEAAALADLAGMAHAPAYAVQLRWGSYYEAISDYGAATQAISQALAHAHQTGDASGMVRMLARLGMLAMRQGEYGQAQERFDQALALFSTGVTDAVAEAEVRYGLGTLHRELSQYAEARAAFMAVLTLSRHINDRQREAQTLSALAGIFFLHERDYEEAAAYVSEALAIRRAIGDRNGQGASLLNLAQVLNRMGDYSRAEDLLRQALTTQQELGNLWWQAIIWNELGVIYLLLGEYAQAEEATAQAISHSRAIGADSVLASALGNLGQILRESGQYSRAKAALLEAYELAQAQGEHYLRANHLSELAALYVEEEAWQNGVEAASAALAILEETGITSAARSADLTVLGLAHLALGQPTLAYEFGRQAYDLLEAGNGEGADFPHRDYHRCARIFRATGHPQLADHALAQARRLLAAQTERISSPQRRQAFLTQVPFNRAIGEEG